MTPSNFGMSHIFPKTGMFGLSDGEEIMTLALFILIRYWCVADGRTDTSLSQRPCYAQLRVGNKMNRIFAVDTMVAFRVPTPPGKSWKFLDFFLQNSRTWKVLEILLPPDVIFEYYNAPDSISAGALS